MEKIKLTKRQKELLWSLLYPYANGGVTTQDKKGFYFTGKNDKKFYINECMELLNLMENK